MIDLVIFDWDGTLMDSQARIVHAMQAAFNAHAAPCPSAAAVREIIGLDLASAVARIAPALEPALVAAIAARYRQEYVAAQGIASPLFAGAPGMLASLRAQGMMLAIATGKSRAGLDRALAETALAPLFAASRTADECAPKPHPAMLREILVELDIQPQRAVMVGDTTFDLEMAAAAAVPAVAVTHGAHSRQRLLAFDPAFVIDALGELPAKLLALAAARAASQERIA